MQSNIKLTGIGAKAPKPAIFAHKKHMLKDYYALLNEIWFNQLDVEKKGEVSEQRFFKFLRENRIC
jgi:hypothetical protein